MEGYRQLDDAEVGAQVAARLRNVFDEEGPDFLGQTLKPLRRQALYVVRSEYALNESQSGLLLPSSILTAESAVAGPRRPFAHVCEGPTRA